MVSSNYICVFVGSLNKYRRLKPLAGNHRHYNERGFLFFFPLFERNGHNIDDPRVLFAVKVL